MEIIVSSHSRNCTQHFTNPQLQIFMLQILSYEAFLHKTVEVMYLEERNCICGTYS
jgi:hypothetical protein